MEVSHDAGRSSTVLYGDRLYQRWWSIRCTTLQMHTHTHTHTHHSSRRHVHHLPQVEVKLRLPGPDAHAALSALLAPGLIATHAQENYFFDGPAGELNSRRVVLRLRFYDVDGKAVLTLKGEQVLVDGIGRASEVEEPVVDPVAARSLLLEPSRLLDLNSDIMAGIKQCVQRLFPLLALLPTAYT